MIDLNDQTVLITGAAGMTGMAVMAHLLREFPRVRLRAAYHGTPPLLRSPRVTFVRADLRVRAAAERAARGCTCAVLAAANTGGAAAALADPARQTTDNLVMDAQSLDALHRAGVSRCVYCSSAVVYPACDGAVREDDLDLNADPPAVYFGVGWAKRAAEQLCRFWHDRGGPACVVLRLANIFGPYARFDPRRANFIPALVRRAAEREDPFEVWGRPDVTRDVIYVDDVAAAVATALMRDDVGFDVFNLGTGAATRVGDVVDWVLDAAAHRPSAVRYKTDRPTTIRARTLDCSRIRRCLGWHPAVTPEEGVRRTMRWWRENGRTWPR